jgi:hypothetical protein
MTTSTPDDFEALKTIVEALKPFPREDQERILRWTREKFGLASTSEQGRGQDRYDHQQGHGSDHGTETKSKDIRTFVNEKNPQSDNQFAATVAYYYRFEAPEAQRKIEITPTDVQEATRLAGRTRLGDPAKTISNAHGQGYFDKTGRGSYALSTVGENLVAMALPQGEGVAARGIVKVKRKAKKTKGNSRKTK